MFKFSKRSIRNMKDVHPDMVLIFTEAIKVSPIDFGVPNDGGVRSSLRQHQMFLDPSIKTKCDGYERVSRHQVKDGDEFGTALDFYAYVGGKSSWNKVQLAIIAGVLMSTANRLEAEGRITSTLTWGGTFGSKTFNGWDKPHCHIEISQP